MRFIPMPGRNFMAATVLMLFAVNGLWTGISRVPPDDWYVQLAYIAGAIFGAAAKGMIFAGLLWLCARGAEGFHLKNPKPWITKAALGIYFIGAALGAYRRHL
jgi:hypothetical protein